MRGLGPRPNGPLSKSQLETVKAEVIFNQESELISSHGLQQGDPLSTLLYFYCGLSIE